MLLEQIIPTSDTTTLEVLKAESKELQLQSGDLFVDIGEPIGGIPLVQTGVLSVYRVEDDKEFLLYYLEAGELCSMAINCCLSHKGSLIRVYADEASNVLVLAPNNVMKAIQSNEDWMQFVMRSITDKFQRLTFNIDDLAFHKVEDRVFHYLEEYEDRFPHGLSKLTHSQIAKDLNTSREVVGRSLKKMIGNGKLVSKNGQITFPD